MAKGSSIADRTAYMLLAMLTGSVCVALGHSVCVWSGIVC
jgi:hypothetical protein